MLKSAGRRLVFVHRDQAPVLVGWLAEDVGLVSKVGDE
jgi:hypothetical protein